MDVKQQERQYRRGLILGLTLAEVMLLVLFCLLLVLLHTFSQNKPLSQSERAAVRLADQVIVADEGQSSENDFKDLFESLTILIQKGNAKTIKALTDAITQLEPPAAGKPQPVYAAAPPAVGVSPASTGSESQTGSGSPDRTAEKKNQTTIDKTSNRERLDAVSKLVEAIRSTRDAKTIEESAQIAKQLADAKPMLGDKSGSVIVRDAIARELKERAEAAKQVRPGGPGTEHPSCWVAADTGKPEYIFDVTLASGSVSVHDNAIPHRAAEQATLPIVGMSFERNLRLADFLTMTLPLYQWSDSRDCRFFVRIIDKTEGHEKAIYKLELRTVGQHFYYFEDIVGPTN